MRKIALLILVVAFGWSSGASALTLDVDYWLLGASDVVVGDDLYDVRFVDASCIELFTGCDSESDFVFDTLEEAAAASVALNDQVWSLLQNDHAPFHGAAGCREKHVHM